MTKKRKAYLIATVIFGILMFAWIFVAVLLTGGRDVADFTPRDSQVMRVFIAVEIVTVVATVVFACLAGRELRKSHPELVTEPPKKKSEKAIRRRGGALSVCALLLAFGLHILGILAGKGENPALDNLCLWGLWGSFGLVLVFLGINIFLKKRYLKGWEDKNVADLTHFILSHRDAAQKTAEEKQAFLGKLKGISDAYGAVLLLLGGCAAFCSGVRSASGSTTVLVMLAALVMMGAFSRIRFRPSKHIFDEDKVFVKEEEYPHLYAMARAAAEAVGCDGQIQIALLADNNAGASKVGDTCVIYLGVILLHVLSEEELRHILLHEFFHMKRQTGEVQRVQDYFDWLNDGKTPHFGAGITDLLFQYFDCVYVFNYNLYRYAVSIGEETLADREMASRGDKKIAASALLKLKYYELYMWEKDVRPDESIFAGEQPQKDVLIRRIRDFRQQMEQRKDHWNALVQKEILSRSASHPTLKMRLEALGVETVTLTQTEDSPAYRQTCSRSLEFMEELICQQRAETYEEDRKENYLEPKATVDAWEEASRPLVAEEYGQVVWALQMLSRLEEAIELCRRAIDELPTAAACQGYFIRGCYRLHCYEDGGIDDIYFAIENNSNYLDEGLPMIGAYCCLTGNREALEHYREKAVELSQADKDIYSQIGVLNKNDRLGRENLPEGLLENVLAYIRSVEDGQIENIYLVRKTITDTFFTSAVVVRFAKDAQEETCQKIMQQIFAYLDTSSDWQFSLFDYRDVARVKVENIEGSCVYTKTAEE